MISLATVAAATEACSTGSGTDAITYAHCFNLVGDAGGLANFAGVLTGLTFTAVAILAGRDVLASGENARTAGDTVTLLLCSCFSFALTSYLFTLVSSEVRPGGRAAALAFCAGIVLGLATMQLFVGIAHLVDHLALGPARFAALLAMVSIVLVIGFEVETAVDSWGKDLSESTAWTSSLGIACLAIFAAFAVLATVLMTPALRVETVPKKLWTPSVGKVAIFSVLVSVICAFAAAFWAEQPYERNLPGGGYLVLVVLVAVAACTYALLARRTLRTAIQVDARRRAAEK